MLVPRERHKMKQKTDKTILIINAIFIFLCPLWATGPSLLTEL